MGPNTFLPWIGVYGVSTLVVFAVGLLVISGNGNSQPLGSRPSGRFDLSASQACPNPLPSDPGDQSRRIAV